MSRGIVFWSSVCSTQRWKFLWKDIYRQRLNQVVQSGIVPAARVALQLSSLVTCNEMEKLLLPYIHNRCSHVLEEEPWYMVYLGFCTDSWGGVTELTESCWTAGLTVNVSLILRYAAKVGSQGRKHKGDFWK